MSRLEDLPTGFLIHALKANPRTLTFPWSTTGEFAGSEIPREAVIHEIMKRGELASLYPDKADQEVAIRGQANLEARLRVWKENLKSSASAQIEVAQRILTAANEKRIASTLDEFNREMVESFQPAGDEQDDITAVIFTSPIPSHPRDWLLNNVYESIKTHLPKVKIIVLADGGGTAEYKQFKNCVRERGWKIIEFEQKMHQSLMLRHALLTPGIITTPLILVAEHDWGIKPLYINWAGIHQTLMSSDKWKLIQLRQDKIGMWEWDNQFFDDPVLVNDIHLLPTRCFQCPTHIARCDWYRKIVTPLITPDFLEKKEVQWALQETGGINEMTCYIPSGPMGRLYHLNGAHVRRPEELGGIGGL